MAAGGGESPETPASASEAPAPERRSWRGHPLARRLPLLLLVGLGVWLWRVTDSPAREIVLQLDGPGWSEVRAIDLQVVGPAGELLEREERFFREGPPPELTTKLDLEAGTYRVQLFVKREGREERTRLVDTVTVGDETYVVRRVRLPASR
jgi:hypothetical protein